MTAGFAPLLLSVLLTGGSWHLLQRGLATTGPAVASAACEWGIALGLAAFAAARRLAARGGGFDLSSAWRRHRGAILGAAAAGTLGNLLAYRVVLEEGAATAALLGNLVPAWLVLIGVCRGERLSAREMLAIAVLLAGAVTFAWRGQAIGLLPVALMALACAGTAAKQLGIVRLAGAGDLLPGLVLLGTFLGAASATIAMLRGEPLPGVAGLAWLLAAAWIGGCAGMLLLAASYAVLGVARAAPFDCLRGPVALGIGVVLGTAELTPLRAVGAGAMVGAVLALVRRRPSSGG